MADLGLSFSPFSQDSKPANNPTAGGNQPSPQEAIRVLSLRVPRQVGAGSPIPGALLNAAGAPSFAGTQGMPSVNGGMDLQQFLALLFGNRNQPGQVGTQPVGPRDVYPDTSMPSMGGGSGNAGSAPLPRVTPGDRPLPPIGQEPIGQNTNGVVPTAPLSPFEPPTPPFGGMGRRQI